MYKFLWLLPAGLKTRTKSQMQPHLFILTLKTLALRLLPLPSHAHTYVPPVHVPQQSDVYLQNVPHLSEMIINMPRIILITKHSSHAHSSSTSAPHRISLNEPVCFSSATKHCLRSRACALTYKLLGCLVIFSFLAGREKFVKQWQCRSRHRESQGETWLFIPF